MIHFLSSKKLALGMTTFSLALFGLVFYLYNLNFEAYFLGLALILFVLVLALIFSLNAYKKEIDRAQEIESLQKKVKDLSSDQSAFYKDLESYFILWIHQIKTPITAAKLMAYNQNDKAMDATLNEIENYTNLAMSYLKLKEPDKDLHFTRIKVHDLIIPILKKYSWSFIDSKTQLIYEPIEDEVLTDANWSAIMIEQIINNALKYARRKTIEIISEDDRLSIRDTGTGIGAEDLPKIFNKGYSGFYGTANQKSSGLGLFIVDKISKRLNQKVQVQSDLGKGTTFSIDFHRTNLTAL